jgi:hypothetical protein
MKLIVQVKKIISSSALVLLFATELCCISQRPPVTGTPAPTSSITLRGGTTLVLRTVQAIDSSSSRPGQTFAAVVSRDTNNVAGQLVLPSGCPVTLVLVRGPRDSAKDRGFELRIASVTVNGDSYLARNESNAGHSAMPSASLGTFLGGVLGPANVWSAQKNSEPSRQIAVTGGRIWVPDDSLLTFRLDQQVRLIGSH